jgi:hypothetical protein
VAGTQNAGKIQLVLSASNPKKFAMLDMTTATKGK